MTPTIPTTTPTTNTASPTSIHIKINRARRDSTTTTNATAATPSQFSKSECGGAAWGGGAAGVVLEPSISLDTIVREYLTNQHAHCINPVVTCPTFDLFQPHRCPEPKSLRAPFTNFTMHNCRRPYTRVLGGGGEGSSVVRKFVYSRYRHTQTYRNPDLDDVFLCCSYTTDDQMVLVGTNKGMVRLYRKGGSEEGSYRVHEAAVTHLATHSSGSLVLTSSTISHEASLWGLDTMFDEKLILQDCMHADFSNAHDKIIGNSTQTARLYDLNTKQIVSEFTPKLSNHYRINKAVLDPTDSLLLTDGALFDVRSGEQLHKFDKISPLLSGVFHRNGLEIISSSEIWDLRTFHLLRTVPALNECDVLFNRAGDVLFGVPLLDLLAYMYEDNVSSARPWETTSFRTLDATDYSSIATVNVKLILASMSVNHSDTQLAVVECDSDTEIQGGDIIDSQVRVYEVGMARQHDDDDDVPDEDDDDLGDEEDDSDSDDQNSQDDLDVDENELNSSEDIPFSSSSFEDDSNDSEAVYFQLSADALDNNPAGSPQAEDEEVDVEGDEDVEEDGEDGEDGEEGQEEEEEEEEAAEEEEEEDESGNASPTPDV